LFALFAGMTPASGAANFPLPRDPGSRRHEGRSVVFFDRSK
jgi:hypothetical protein